MTHAVEVDVRHQVGDFRLAVAFAVESGLAVLFGPSGAGKSLTLALIAGLARPDAGRITIGGRVVADGDARIHVPTQQRRIGMVFQDGLLLPHRSVVDNVALAVRQQSGRTQRRQVALEWLERVGAEGLASRRPATLSGGQRQRVALARALAGEPAVLLLDEPISALDQAVRRQLRLLIRQVVVSTAVPSLLVTHDADEAEELGDLIIGYEDGMITGTRRVIRPEAGPTDRPAGPALAPVAHERD